MTIIMSLNSILLKKVFIIIFYYSLASIYRGFAVEQTVQEIHWRSKVYS